MTGEILTELGDLTNLQDLDLGGNQLTGEILTELGDLTNLQDLDLGGNRLTGEIPRELGNLTNLQDLDLGGNRLTGEIPRELGNLANLKSLVLRYNRLTGEIPAELGNLAKLERLWLHDNKLSGMIPTELGNLTNLKSLVLSGNQLSGEIPAELGNLAKLEILVLGHNQLTGKIPVELGNFANLQRLNLSYNALRGDIPSGFGNFTHLGTLDLGGNKLSGEIPAELGNLTNLRELSLNSNKLSGEIPAELGNLATLRFLVLDNNQLSGEIPVELGNLANLVYLYLSGNRLTGCIPAGLRDVSHNDLDHLGLGFCTGTGPTQPSTGNLAGDCATDGEVASPANNPGLVADCQVLLASRDTLAGTWTLNWSASTPMDNWEGIHLRGTPRRVTNLNLEGWGLTGTIPAALGDLAKLEILVLAHTQLTGPIPAALGNLANLENLSLDNNQLSGEIPAALGNLANLQKLYLSGNQLTGCIPAGLKSVPGNDFTGLGLDFCPGTTTPTPSGPCLEFESLGLLTTPVTRTGAWADDCASQARPGSYARYYSFTLSEAGRVEINLTAGVDTYLVLRQGEGRDGEVVADNDNVGSRNYNSSINRMLDAGTYTVEATTYFGRQTGGFTLSVRPLQPIEKLGVLTSSVDRSNSVWTREHQSTQRPGSHARFYVFTLSKPTHVAINLTSPEDSYLYVLDSSGTVVHEHDNVTTRNLNSRIDRNFDAGAYTIEATTYFPGQTGTFHLSIGYFGATEG